uniref:protein acetyllysine N-acetyltransferase n=1 Tax=Arcella intermedia TaxID=1963864 RepID=A0A6B2L6V5_9EUKA
MVAFTGAGISTAAGISDFRGPNGIWTKRDQGTPVPRTFPLATAPTLTHLSLLSLHTHGHLHALISTNTDGLHLLSGFPLASFQELHGNRNIEACASCGRVYYRRFPVRPNDITCKTRLTARRCDGCRTPLRWTNVAFGQTLPDLGLENAYRLAERADLSVVLGTTMKVEPAASLPFEGRKHGETKVVLVNLQRTDCDQKCDLRIFAPCDEVAKLLMKELGLEVPEYVPLDLAGNVEWQKLFQECYKFRSVSDNWYDGPLDPTVLKQEEEVSWGLGWFMKSTPRMRCLATMKESTIARGENEISLNKGDMVEVLKRSKNEEGHSWCYVAKVGTSNNEPIQLGCVWEHCLQYKNS